VVPRVNYTDESVTSTFLGVSRQMSEALNLRVATAKYLGPSFGCSLTMETFKKPKEYYDFDKMKDLIEYDDLPLSASICIDAADDDTCSVESEPKTTTTLPDSLNVDCFNSILDAEFSDEAYVTNQTRAIVISHDGQLLTERYQSLLNIHSNTKLLGWSMTKSVFSAIVGTAIQQGLLTLDTPAKLEHLRPEQRERIVEKNNGEVITFRHLLQMYDILGFVEDYGVMKDVVFMLYGTYETVKFASTRPSYPDANRSPSEGWYYSSAVSNLLSAELRSLFSSDEEYWEFPHKHLFAKINASSFAIEMDAQGVFVASSFGYAVS
jgi:CubicO group peptidase (beta-lactamase class C family)